MDEETLELESILREDRRYESIDFNMSNQMIMNEEVHLIVKQVSEDEDRPKAKY